MDLRYPFLALANLIAGGFLVAATYGFSAGTAVTLGFAVSIAVALIGLGMLYSGFRKPGPMVLGSLTAILAIWTIVATNVFADDTARWLVFASALGHVGLALIGLIRHEISTDRVVHTLEVSAERKAAPVR